MRRILCQWKIHWHQLGSNQRPSELYHSTLTTVLPYRGPHTVVEPREISSNIQIFDNGRTWELSAAFTEIFFHRHKNIRSKAQRLQMKKGAVCFWNCVILCIVVTMGNILENAARSSPEIFLVCNIRTFLALFFWSLGIFLRMLFLNAWNLYPVFEVGEHMLPPNDTCGVIGVWCLGKPTRLWEFLTHLTSVSVIYSHFVVTFTPTCYCAYIRLVIFYCELLRVVIFSTSLQILVSYHISFSYMLCLFSVFVFAYVCRYL